MAATRATQALDRAGIPYTLHEYAYDPGASRIGLQAAGALGVDPACVLKTLMARADGRPVCLLVPSDREAAMKRVAAAFGAKTAAMLPPAEAERLTGYVVGGISPLGQRRRVPTAVEAMALAAEAVFVNGGRRGLQIRLRGADLLGVLDARLAPLVQTDHAPPER